MKIRVSDKLNESKYSGEFDFIDILNDYAGRTLVEMIEMVVDETDPVLVKVRDALIKELKDNFGYDYVL